MHTPLWTPPYNPIKSLNASSYPEHSLLSNSKVYFPFSSSWFSLHQDAKAFTRYLFTMAFYFSLYRGRETDVTPRLYFPTIYNLTLTRKDSNLLNLSFCSWGLGSKMECRGFKSEIPSACVKCPIGSRWVLFSLPAPHPQCPSPRLLLGIYAGLP